jgi:hypothetical protein
MAKFGSLQRMRGEMLTMPQAAWTAIQRLALVKSVSLQHEYHLILEMRSADSLSSKTTDLVVNLIRAESPRQSHTTTQRPTFPELHNLTFHEHDAVR